jgi:acyl-coenzyme A thioesterase PaaI-like protein
MSADYSFMRTEMPLTQFNRNYVGTQFGGSMYAMTDPFYMLMLIQILGNDYLVWDKAASIEFVKPGRERVFAEFSLAPEEIALVKSKTANGEKYFFEKDVLVQSVDGELIAKVHKIIYIRKKSRS